MGVQGRLPGVLAATAAIYALGDAVGAWLASDHAVLTPVRPAAGIAVAALLVLGLRAWPAIAAGSLLVSYVILRHAGAAAAIAFGNTFAAVVAAALTMRFARGHRAFERGPDLFRFALAAGVVAPAVAATVTMTALGLFGLELPGGTLRPWFRLWLGDATSIVLTAPFYVLLTLPQERPRAGRIELAAMATSLGVLLVAVFGMPSNIQRDLPLALPMLPLMLWSAFRASATLTAGLGVVMAIVSVYRSLWQFGPFEFGSPANALPVILFIVAMVSLLLLAMAAESRFRRTIESELRTLNDTLEGRVQERTSELRRMHNRLAESQAAAQIGNWEWDVTTNSLWWSDEMCRIFGLAAAPQGYELYLELIHPDDQAMTDAAVKKAIQTGQAFTFEHRIIRPDGELRVIHARGRAEFDPSGALRRLMGTGHDITERLRADEARAQLTLEQEKLREAEETNRQKDAFLATLSHELRTPLNAALGWTHILRESIQEEHRDSRVVQAIYRNLKLQARIVSDILDISRIARGALALDRERVNMRTVFEVAAETVRDAAASRGVTIEITGGQADVVGDNRRLQQVAWNLLSNAVKFAAPQGRVTVAIRETGDGLECSVEDDGCGIAPGFLPHVFEQFRQADPSMTREHGGLGLGLAIVREIVSMHRGTITASNRPAGGARFVLRLPRDPAAEGAAVGSSRASATSETV